MSQKSSSKAEALAVSLLESAARKDLGEFLSMFRKDWAAKLDFTQPLTFLDAEMPLYVPAEQLNRENTFTFFVKATLKTGKSCRFILHTIWMGSAKFAVGIADVPDNVVNGFYMPTNEN